MIFQIALLTICQWQDPSGVVVQRDRSEAVEVGSPGLLNGEKLRVDGQIGATAGIRTYSGGLHLDGIFWNDGIIERSGFPGYLYFKSNLPASSQAADFYFSSANKRTNGYGLCLQNAGQSTFCVGWDGTISTGKTILVGPGTGSGNIAVQPAFDSDYSYLVLMGRLVGGGTHPAIHGATTLGNVNRLGKGEYVFQIRDGDHNDMLIDSDGSPWFAGNNITLGVGNGGALVVPGGLILDPGENFSTTVLGAGGLRVQDGPVYGHVVESLPSAPDFAKLTKVGQSETWLDADCDCVKMAIKTSVGIKTITLPFD